MRLRRNRDQTVVALFLSAPFSLLRFNDTEETGLDQATHENWLVHQDQYVEGIAVLAFCPWNGSEIEWKNGAIRQHRLQNIDLTLRVIAVLVPATLRCLNNNIETVGLRIERR